MDEMVIFTRTYDLVSWLIPHTEKFPRNQRFVTTKRLQDAVLDFQEYLIEANAAEPGRERLATLRRADAALIRVRLYLRLANRWGWTAQDQYEHSSGMVAEVGRLLGGWMRQTAPKATVRGAPGAD